MAEGDKIFNSKRFLFSYLIIVGFLIVLWMNRLPLMHDDQRDIPVDLQSFVESPARPLPQLKLITRGKLALTNEWLQGKWTFVYFTHSHCLPDCQASLEKIKSLQADFANADFQFLAIGIDSDHEAVETLNQFLNSQDVDITAASTSASEIEKLAKTFIALYLQTDFTDGSYQIEQEHHIFLVDPKARVYATFRSPYKDIRSQFLGLRHFYARSE